MVRLNTERDRPQQISSVINLCLIGLSSTLLATSFALSQTAATEEVARSEPDNAAQQSRDSSSSDKDAEIIQELERMRNRIQELESELKRRHADSSAVVDAGRSAPVGTQQLVGGLEASPQPIVQADSPAAGATPAKAEPFAFADWTWLNGNPRTKEPAFDSKFFTP